MICLIKQDFLSIINDNDFHPLLIDSKQIHPIF